MPQTHTLYTHRLVRPVLHLLLTRESSFQPAPCLRPAITSTVQRNGTTASPCISASMVLKLRVEGTLQSTKASP